jgi:hypothetical protein
MQEKRRLARHHQHKASLMEEELLLDNAVIPDAPPTPLPPTPPPATPPPPESPSLPPPPEANRAVRRLGIGDQQSAESSPPPALERSLNLASVQDWLPMDNHYASAPFLLNKCPIVILTVDAESSGSVRDLHCWAYTFDIKVTTSILNLKLKLQYQAV